MNEEYLKWISHSDMPQALLSDLQSVVSDEKGIADRFYTRLAFGTGGLRGVIGAGTNRMNIFTVARATQGLADYLAETGGGSVCIAYDTRTMSREFAAAAANVLCSNGIEVFIFDDVRPTPMLSFAVRYKKASAGIVITASHNPPEYNGYKVYGSDGGQITDDMANAILVCIDRYDELDDAIIARLNSVHGRGALIGMDDVDKPYFDRVIGLSMRKDVIAKHAGELRILYSPLHGAGLMPIPHVLDALGYKDVHIVSEQADHDGNFPTVQVPNPENDAVYEIALRHAATLQPDIIIATDPDCDRIGLMARKDDGRLCEKSVIAASEPQSHPKSIDFQEIPDQVRDDGSVFTQSDDLYRPFTGNEIGLLLISYIIDARRDADTLRENSAVIKTIVTTELARAICDRNKVHVEDTLTGFKYIGEKIGVWGKTGAYDFLFGFEESYGYLSGSFVRDKDAVIAAALIAEMATYYKAQGLSLPDVMDAIYDQYGFSQTKLISKTLAGPSGVQQTVNIIEYLREHYRDVFRDDSLDAVADYSLSKETDMKTGNESPVPLPKSNVLKFIFSDGSWMAFRPSGTEPKIKVYIEAMGKDKDQVTLRLGKLTEVGERMVSTDL
jgi:phosphoglucomutase